MDFVVVGIFIGAIIVGIGAGIRDLGPRRRPFITRRVRRQIEPEAMAKAWRRFCQSIGTLVLTMGMIVILATVVAMVLSLSDSTGWLMVAASTALTLVVSGIGVLVIPGHYQRGGFDPIMRTVTVRPKALPPVVVHDVEVPLSELPGNSIDDLFLLDMPRDDAEPAVMQADGIPVTDVPAPAAEPTIERGPEIAAMEETVEVPPPTQQAEPAPKVAFELQPERRPGRRVTFSRPAANRSEPEPEPEQARPLSEPEIAPPAYEPPLIDPDEDLPAWNAPALEIPQPKPYVPPPPARVERSQPDPETGFQSSLFADLDAQAGEQADVAGPFQSRLLNELTREERKPAPEPEGGGADVLIEEISLPDRNPIEQRNANNGR